MGHVCLGLCDYQLRASLGWALRTIGLLLARVHSAHTVTLIDVCLHSRFDEDGRGTGS